MKVTKDSFKERIIEIINSIQSLPLRMPQITMVFKNSIVTTEAWESRYISVEYNGVPEDVLYLNVMLGDKTIVVEAGEVCDSKTYSLVKEWANVPNPYIVRDEAIRNLGKIADLY